MANFVHRIASWIANEIVVKALSKSKGFNKFVGKTAQGVDKVENVVKGGREALTATRSEVGKEASTFWAGFKEEVRKDLGMSNKKSKGASMSGKNTDLKL